MIALGLLVGILAALLLARSLHRATRGLDDILEADRQRAAMRRAMEKHPSTKRQP